MVFTVLRALSRFSWKSHISVNLHAVEARSSLFMTFFDFRVFEITLHLRKQPPLCSHMLISAFQAMSIIQVARACRSRCSAGKPNADILEMCVSSRRGVHFQQTQGVPTLLVGMAHILKFSKMSSKIRHRKSQSTLLSRPDARF